MPAAKSWPSPAMVISRIVAIVRRAFDRVGQRRVHGDGDRVAPLGPVEGDRQHAAALLDPHMFAHRLPPESGDALRRRRLSPATSTKAEGTQTMKFFADTADIAEIRELADTGLLDGVTTNPR